MRINGNPRMPELPDTGSVTRDTQARSTEPVSGHPENVAAVTNFSRVSQLEAQVRQLPEIRQDKVQALARAIRNGQYKVSSDEIANSLFSEIAPTAALAG